MSVQSLLIHRYPRVPPEIVEKIIIRAEGKVQHDFDVYALASPIVIRVNAAFDLLDRLQERLRLINCEDHELCAEVEEIIHEEVDRLIIEIIEQ